MDMSLLRRGDIRIQALAPARIDFRVLVATLQAVQLASPTARAESRCGGEGDRASGAAEPLTEIVLGAPHWQDAVLEQGGSFNPQFARGIDPE